MKELVTFITFSVKGVGGTSGERLQGITSKVKKVLLKNGWTETEKPDVLGTSFRTLPESLLSDAKICLAHAAKHYRSEATITLKVHKDTWVGEEEKL